MVLTLSEHKHSYSSHFSPSRHYALRFGASGGMVSKDNKNIRNYETEKSNYQRQEYPVVFNLQTILNYEELSGRSFFDDPLKRLQSQISLVFSAIIAADENTSVKAEDFLKADSGKAVTDIINAFTVVMTMAGDFFKTPAVAAKDTEQEEGKEDGDGGKNA